MAITSDMRILAEAVLQGDEIAARGLADLISENSAHPEYRYSKAYVEKLEKVLKIVQVFIKGAGIKGYEQFSLLAVDVGSLIQIRDQLWKLEQWSKQEFRRGFGFG